MYSLNAQLSPNFKASEFFVTSHSGGQAGLWEDFVNLPEKEKARVWNNLLRLTARLELLRAAHGSRSITISSGWRSNRVNTLIYKEIGKKPINSLHLIGQAADFTISGVLNSTVQQWALKNWAGGVGLAKSFTHLDTGPKRQWRY